MSDLRARVAYLQGLMEGMGVEAAGPQGRILSEIVHVLEDMADAVTDVVEHQDDLAGYIEEVDEDLTDLAGDVYTGDEAEDDEAEVNLGELRCPQCGQTLALEAGAVDGREGLSIVCPGCGTMVGKVEESQ